MILSVSEHYNKQSLLLLWVRIVYFQNGELRARCSIVGQRKARLLQSMTSDLAESKRLRSAIEGMHMDMGRLNDLIGKSGRRVLEGFTSVIGVHAKK